MPQNTPMKRQFTTIDNRTVMSNLPQHWGGNDWAITGVDNPLPVGNYVQTRAGVWIPQKGSDDGAADVRLTGRKVEEVIPFPRQVRTSDVYQVVNVPSGAIGLVVTAVVHGVTGTFDAGQGFRLNVTQLDNISAWGMFRLVTNRLSKTSRHHVYIYPGLNLSNLDLITDSQVLGVSMIPHTRITITMEINGTFNGGEGFDCELRYYWFY